MGRKSESADFSAFRTVTCRHISLYVVSHARQNVATDLVGGTRGGAELLDVGFHGGMDLLEVAQVYQRSGLVLVYKK